MNATPSTATAAAAADDEDDDAGDTADGGVMFGRLRARVKLYYRIKAAISGTESCHQQLHSALDAADF